MQNEIFIPGCVENVIRRIEEAGAEAYIVGGSVRDSLMGRPVHDYDLTTSAEPQEMLEIFSRPDDRVLPTGIKHGTVSVRSGGEWLEITTYRVDGDYSDGRHPDTVAFTRTLAEDLSRRDFTVNAMAYSAGRGLVDLFGGQSDIAAGIVRCVGDPTRRFTEDALRIMRAFRFSAKLGFEIDAATLEAAVRLKKRLGMIAAERIAKEFDGILEAPGAAQAIELMRSVGIFEVILPDVADEISGADCAFFARLRADAALRLGALLRGTAREKVEAALRSLKVSNDYAKKVLAAAVFPLPQDAGAAAVRRYAGAYEAHAEDVLEVAAARGEVLGDGVTPAGAALETLGAVRKSGAPLTLRALAVNGNDLAAAGLAKGRETGRMLAALLDEVLEDPARNERGYLLARAGELAAAKRAE